ncbi:hypothetical protein ACNS7O_14740 (plasmid) [Haloferacaceae archaeon DSL9]
MNVGTKNLNTDRQPPMAIPLRHFVVGVGFLLAGGLLGVGTALGAVPASGGLARVHLLLVGWVCVTIMGAMTQFVPVWSGVELHSRRLATAQLWLVTVGLLGFATALAVGRLGWLTPFGALMVLGFWTFAYNTGRTLWVVESYDITERHFALALGFFVLLTSLGYFLAIDFVHPVFVHLPFDRGDVVAAHATLAVFGAVLTTVLGALYQLATMFTQTKLRGIDVHIRRFEEVGYPLGVLLLAGGRLFGVGPAARIGGLLVAASLFGIGVILARKFHETQVDWTPMLSRYAVLASALLLWSIVTIPAWLRDPLSREALLGAPGAFYLLVLGVVGFVVLGTLYHVVPFIVWVHRYSGLLGLEPVPMIDDLYDGRLARTDFALFVLGVGGLVATDWFGLPVTVALAASIAVATGAAVFFANVLLVVRNPSPHTIAGVLFTRFASDEAGERSAADQDRSASGGG